MSGSNIPCRVLTAFDALAAAQCVNAHLHVRQEQGDERQTLVVLKLYAKALLEADAARALRSLVPQCPVCRTDGADGMVIAPLQVLLDWCKWLMEHGYDEGRTIELILERHFHAAFEVRFPRTRMRLEGRPRVMAVLNVTPDSFSDGGRYACREAAVAHALEMVRQAAEIVDVGGESTRPGAAPVSEEEELRRVVPVVEALAASTAVPVSVDTSKHEVARRALDAGASMVNDVTSLRGDPRMAALVAERGVPIVLMHMKGEPRTMQERPHYEDLMCEVLEFLAERIEAAVAAGIQREMVIVDPGIGFGKTPEHNLELLARLEEFRVLGCPILVGASRKSTLGLITGRDVEGRLSGSLSAAVMAALHGAHILRVHDVAETLDALRVCESIRRARIVSD